MTRLFLALGVALTFAVPGQAQAPKEVRVGIIGCDTSHAGVFTSYFNDPKIAQELELTGMKVVAAFPGGSSDLPLSRDRVGKFTDQLRDKHNVEIVDSIEKLLAKVDVVLLLSVDGRVHWKQGEIVLKSGKPVFIDKPFASTLADAMRLVELARTTKTPMFSSSSARFSKPVSDMKADAKIGPVIGCMSYGDCPYFEHHADLAFYGIHGLSLTYAIMGPGCVSVTRTQTKDTDVLTGVWSDGRVATYRGLRTGKQREFGAIAFCKNGNVPNLESSGYKPQIKEIGKFFRTGVAPISMDEMVELIAVIEAADVSKERGGAPVAIADVMKAARDKLTP